MYAYLSGSDGGTMYGITRWLMIIIFWYAALTDKLHKYFGSNRVVIAIPNSHPPVEWWAVNLGCKNTIFGTLVDTKRCKSAKYGLLNAYIDRVPIGVKTWLHFLSSFSSTHRRAAISMWTGVRAWTAMATPDGRRRPRRRCGCALTKTTTGGKQARRYRRCPPRRRRRRRRCQPHDHLRRHRCHRVRLYHH